MVTMDKKSAFFRRNMRFFPIRSIENETIDKVSTKSRQKTTN